NEPLLTTQVHLNSPQADRLGISNFDTELSLMMRYNADGMPMGTIWQGDYPVNVCLKGTHADYGTRQQLGDELINAEGGLRQVPLRQVATVTPQWEYGQMGHRNGLRTTTIMAEVTNGLNVTQVTYQLQNELKGHALPEGISMTWGGEIAENNANMPMLISALLISVVIIFFLLVYHFKRISIALLLMIGLLLCLFGTVVGILMNGELTMTCFLGFISLMGILVRNAIIMYDYAEELQETEHLSPREAILLSAKRRMRPIFLTSAAASMGVIPMVLKNSPLWGPMGNVIFYGTLITMVFILTVLPIGYSMVRKND
ncbi:MAG: efflux RND transporter permease subunit, partial [Muribaculaceae bacterium]|nr:efflux RND transporter permease subunit [Muribaculaceae bacterium]